MFSMAVDAACDSDETIYNQLLELLDYNSSSEGGKVAVALLQKLYKLGPTSANSTENSERKQAKEKLIDSMCHNFLYTVHLGTHSATFNVQEEAYNVSKLLHSYHNNIFIDDIFTSVLKVFSVITSGKLPKSNSDGGTKRDNMILLNLKSRIRILLSHFCAYILPWIRGNSGYLGILGSSTAEQLWYSSRSSNNSKNSINYCDVNILARFRESNVHEALVWIGRTQQILLSSVVSDKVIVILLLIQYLFQLFCLLSRY